MFSWVYRNETLTMLFSFRAAKSECYIHSHYHWRKASSHLSGGYAYRSARYPFADDSNDQCSFDNSYSYHCDSDHSESTPTPSTGVAVAVYTSCKTAGETACSYKWEVFTQKLPSYDFAGCSTKAQYIPARQPPNGG